MTFFDEPIHEGAWWCAFARVLVLVVWPESRREKCVADQCGRRGLGTGARGGVAARRVLVGEVTVVRVRPCDSSLSHPVLLSPERRIGANPPSTRTAVWYVFALCTLCLRICVLYAHARTKNVSPVHACVCIWACGRAFQMSLGSPTSLWQHLHCVSPL